LLSGRLARLSRSVLLCAAAGLVLAGCGFDGSAGSLNVDPGKYDLYRCNDLVARWKILTDRQNELRNLMDKASQSTAGVVIGATTYRPEYEDVLAEEKIVQRQAVEKKCDLVATFQSDQGIH
jgi:hypothetical protein